MLRPFPSHRFLLPPLLAVLSLAPASQYARAADLPPLRAEHPPLFTADVAISIDSLAHPSLAVSFSMAHPELQWIRQGDRYAAGAEITVALEPRGRARIYGDVWERRLLVSSFIEAHSPSASLTDRRSFEVPPGSYDVRVSVRDLNGGESSTAHDRIEVPDYSRVPVGFADLELGVMDSLGGYSPLPTRQFGFNVDRLAARVSLFDRRPGPWPRTLPFHYKILDDEGQEVRSGVEQATLDHSASPVILRPGSTDLFLGSYVLAVELVQGKSHWHVERSFTVEESGPPHGKEFERILEPLSYIAEPGEIDRLRALPPQEQASGWEEFWRHRDPTPDTPRNEALLEFFRRLRYAERHFQGFGPGWRSDMGRIYIKYGPPDQIESRPASLQTEQIEIWYYKDPYRRFVFADREGFGRYVLANPGAE